MFSGDVEPKGTTEQTLDSQEMFSLISNIGRSGTAYKLEKRSSGQCSPGKIVMLLSLLLQILNDLDLSRKKRLKLCPCYQSSINSELRWDEAPDISADSSIDQHQLCGNSKCANG